MVDTRAKTSRLPAALIRRGDHVCAPFASRAEQEELVIDFVRGGLEADERVWYFADTTETDRILALLDHAGVRVDEPLVRGQLDVFPSGSWLEGHPGVDAARMVARLQDAVDRALRSGYRGIRFAGEMSWVSGSAGAGLRDLERRLDGFYARHPAAGLCQYDSRRLKERELEDLVALHPDLARPPRVTDHGLLRISDADLRGASLRVAGEIDISTLPLLTEALAAAIASGRDVELDFRRLRFIDLSGVRQLIDAGQRLRPARRLLIRDPPWVLCRQLELVPGWEGVLEICR